ncbi:PEBP-like protein [Dendrothele bispora CBS 962.96]|uniref:PEBP-like protein n=1 Tax=Dendrothele bispora (strain CBS 962.96) TaxID=1314807 RepID=A0A4S8MZY9_DENBC|nr:PEBP-like protein [Dendrothele bispora CBS 962.96]
MMRTLLFATIVLAGTAFAQFTQSLDNVTQAFTNAKIVPDVLPSFSPRALLNVTFTDASMQSVNVTPGIQLTMAQTAQEPQFFFLANVTIPPNLLYVVAIVDPDAPTPQNANISQFRHFLGGGFSVDSTTGLLMNNTAALTDFAPPTPPAGSDPHRYVVLAYLQPDNFDSIANQFVNASTNRMNFNITTFAQATNLSAPLAANFFLTGPDNSSSTGTSSSASPSGTSPGGSGGTSDASGKDMLGGLTWFMGLLVGILLS